MKTSRKRRLLALCMSIMMMLTSVQGTGFVAFAEETVSTEMDLEEVMSADETVQAEAEPEVQAEQYVYEEPEVQAQEYVYEEPEVQELPEAPQEEQQVEEVYTSDDSAAQALAPEVQEIQEELHEDAVDNEGLLDEQIVSDEETGDVLDGLMEEEFIEEEEVFEEETDSADEVENADRAGRDVELYPYITALQLYRNGDKIDSGATVNAGDAIKLEMSYTIPGSVFAGAASFTYQLPVTMEIAQAFSGDIKQGSTVVGHFYVTTEGLVTFIFNDDYNRGNDTTQNTFEISGTANYVENQDGDEVKFKYGEDSQQIVVVIPGDFTMKKTSKRRFPNGLSNGSRIDYTVEISSTYGTNENFSIEDKLTVTNEEGFDSILLDQTSFDITDADGNTVTGYNLTIAADGRSYTITDLPKLGRGGSYTLTYTVDVMQKSPTSDSNDAANKTSRIRNDISVTSEETKTDTATITYQGSRLYKVASNSDMANGMYWRIGGRTNGADMTGLILADTASTNITGFSYFSLIGQRANGTEYTVASVMSDITYNRNNSPEWSLTFPSDAGKSWKWSDVTRWEGVYYTAVPEGTADGSQITITNHAEIEVDPGITWEVDATGIGTPSRTTVNKEAVGQMTDAGTHLEATWKFSIDYENIDQRSVTYPNAYLSIRDNIYAAYYSNDGRTYANGNYFRDHYAILGVLRQELLEGVRITVDGYAEPMTLDEAVQNKILRTYEFEFTDFSTDAATTNASAKVKTFQIRLYNYKGEMPKITNMSIDKYTTYMDKSHLTYGKRWRIQNALASNAISKAVFQYYDVTQPALEKLVLSANGATWEKNASKTITANNKTLVYLLKASVPEGQTEITVTDRLPEGLTIDTAQLYALGNGGAVRVGSFEDGLKLENWTAAGRTGNIEITYDSDNRTVTVTAKNLGTDLALGRDRMVGIQLTATIEKDLSELPGSTHTAASAANPGFLIYRHTFVNTAVCGDVTSTAVVNATQSTFGIWKSAKQVTDANGNVTNRVHYRIQINKQGLDLLEGSDILTLTDTAASGDVNMSLDRSSIKLSTGKEVPSETVVGATTLAADEPLEISVLKINESIHETGNHREGFTVEVPDGIPLVLEYEYIVSPNNGAGGSGTISNTAELEGIAKMETKDATRTVSASATSDHASLTLRKVDADNYAKFLDQAKFDLVDVNSDTTIEADFDVSGEDGRVFDYYAADNKLQGGILYKIVEKKAPEGYLLDDTPFYFIIKCDGAISEGVTVLTDAQAREKAGVPDEIKDEDIHYLEPSKGSYFDLENEKAYELQVEKVSTAGAVLAGAVFELWKADETADAKITGTNKTGKLISTMATAADGQIRFEELAAGEYYLVETQAPAGCQLLEEPVIRLTIDVHGVTMQETADYRISGLGQRGSVTSTADTNAASSWSFCLNPVRHQPSSTTGYTMRSGVSYETMAAYTDETLSTEDYRRVQRALYWYIAKHSTDQSYNTYMAVQRVIWAVVGHRAAPQIEDSITEILWGNGSTTGIVNISDYDSAIDAGLNINLYVTPDSSIQNMITAGVVSSPVVVNGAKVTVKNAAAPELPVDNTIEVKGTKVWRNDSGNADKRPASIAIVLLADGEEKETVIVNAQEGDTWNWNITNLPKVNENGAEIVYTVKELSVDGYSSAITGSAAEDFVITNTYVGKTSVSVVKRWNDADNQDGKRANSVTVHLYADGADTGKSETLSEANNWSALFSDLDEYQSGQKIVYTVVEDAVVGYTTEITGDALAGYTVTNTHAPEKIDIEGTKTWDDSDNQDGKRPDSITVRLYANGTEKDHIEVTAENNWTYTFSGLDKFENGTQIVYTVTEDAVTDYTTEINGYHITNSYTPGKTSVSVVKRWKDADNQDGKRANSVTVHLYADGADTGKSETLSEVNNWSARFSDLDEYQSGQKIVYTVVEDAVAGYTTKITGDAAEGYTVTNTHAPEKIDIEGTKTWDDNNNQAETRPNSIVVRLLADGNEVDHREVTEDDSWTYSFTGLDRYAAGKEIAYTVTEDAVEGYVTSYDENNITNKVTLIKVSKIDITDGEELDGAHIQILDETGAVIEEWDSAAGEPAEIYGLKTGVTYTLKETVAPDGYSVTSDTTFMISEEGTVSTTGSKSYDNENNTVLLVEDELTKFTVSKTDITGEEELEGAELQIVDPTTGEVVKTIGGEQLKWTSKKDEDGKTAHTIEGLKEGTYILQETVAPYGYVVTTDTTFTLTKEGKIEVGGTEVTDNAILVKNDKRVVTLYAVKLSELGDYLVNAGMAVYEVNNSQRADSALESWTTNGDVHELKLNVGTYELVETKAPQGYALAEAIRFTVSNDGSVSRADGQQLGRYGDSASVVLMMTDTKVAGEMDQSFAKVDKYGRGVVGAEMTITTSEGNIIASWTTDGKIHTESLPAGTYSLNETSAPSGYLTAASISFTVNEAGQVTDGAVNIEGVDADVVMVDEFEKEQTVMISKQDVNGNEIAGAKLELRDTDGNVLAGWTTRQGETTQITLPAGTYVLHEVSAPDGYQVAKDITFTVAADGTVTVAGDNANGVDRTVIMVDEKIAEETEKPGNGGNGGNNGNGGNGSKGGGSKGSSSGSSGSTGKSGSGSVKTGDETPIGATAAALLLSLVCAAYVMKKRKEEEA